MTLVARRQAELDRVAADLPGTRVLAADLSTIEACAGFAERVGETPDIVIHCAGAGRWLAVEETDPEEAVSMMGAPYFSSFFATRVLLPGMLARGSGMHVYLNSPASILPIPGAAGYTGARHALRGFAGALRAEVAGRGVHVLHFVAGKVKSTYFDNNPGSELRIPGISKWIPDLSVEDCAARVCNAIEGRRKEVFAPFMLWAFYQFYRLVPWMVDAMVRGTGWKAPSR